MTNSFVPGRGRRRKKTDFNPSHEFVNSAVQEYLQNGGHINKVDITNINYHGLLSIKEHVSPADDFLLGN